MNDLLLWHHVRQFQTQRLRFRQAGWLYLGFEETSQLKEASHIGDRVGTNLIEEGWRLHFSQPIAWILASLLIQYKYKLIQRMRNMDSELTIQCLSMHRSSLNNRTSRRFRHDLDAPLGGSNPQFNLQACHSYIRSRYWR